MLLRRLQAFAAHEGRSASFLLFMVSLLTFGVFIPFLGIYYDDWVSYEVYSRFGLGALLNFTGGQARPITALYMAVGMHSVFVSHLLMFGIHTANVLLIAWMLRTVLPRSAWLATLAAGLWAVYPAYWLRPTNIALTIDGAMFFCLASIALGLWAQRLAGWRRWGVTLLSLACIPLYLFSYELVIAAEPLRFILYWLAQEGETWHVRLRRTVVRALPFVVVLGALVYYRLYGFESYGFYRSINYNTFYGLSAALDRLVSLGPDLASYVLWEVWRDTAFTWLVRLEDLHILLMVPLVVAFTSYILLFARAHELTRRDYLTYGALCLTGLALLVVGFLPLFATASIHDRDPLSSRWNIIAMLGAVLFIANACGLVSSLGRGRAAPIVAGVLCLPIFLGGIAHIQNTLAYVHEWQDIRSLWWQTARLVPNVSDGTTLIVQNSLITSARNGAMPYETHVQGTMFFNNPLVTALQSGDVGADQGFGFGFDNGDWALVWPYDVRQALFLVNLNGCVHLVDPSQSVPAGVTLNEREAQFVPLLPPPSTRLREAQPSAFRYLFEPEYIAPECR